MPDSHRKFIAAYNDAIAVKMMADYWASSDAINSTLKTALKPKETQRVVWK